MLRLRTILLTCAALALLLVWPAAGAEAKLKNHLEHAKAALLKKNFKKAGSELRAASDYLGKATVDTPGAAKEGLEASASELKTLAEDVEKGSVTEAKRIDEASARGYYALARERFVTATEAGTKKDAKATGRALKDAADHLEAGATVAGRDLGNSAKDVAKGTREVAGKLVKGSGWTSEEVGRGMEAFGKELTRLGRHESSMR